ncbi:MAG: hypothetical protein E7665_02355 [Ruminococcaceae bacterium]|nr:hypothetical protein [Oscillospiraceae bacterium]
MYRSVIWDFDGTLFDTYPSIISVYMEELEKKGIKEDRDHVEFLFRTSFGHIWGYLTDTYGLTKEYYDSIEPIWRKKEIEMSYPFPGIRELLTDIVNNGGKNYIYTHRNNTTLLFLEKEEMTHLFSDMVLSEEGFPAKPAPDALNALMKRNSINPKEAIMIGDREIDVRSGFNANIASCLFLAMDYSNTCASFIAKNADELRKIIMQ